MGTPMTPPFLAAGAAAGCTDEATARREAGRRLFAADMMMGDACLRVRE